MSESFDLDSLTREFRDEGRDQVDRLDAVLLELEREGSLADETRAEILRTLHTLKGNAGMLGLGPVRDYVHVLETALKSGDRTWSDATVERLFEGAAALRRAVEAAGTDGQDDAFKALSVARHRLEELETAAAGTVTEPRAGGEEARAAAAATDVLRVSFAKLDTLLNQVGELLGEADALMEAAADATPRLRDRAEAVQRRTDELRDLVMSLRLVPIGRTLGRFPAMARRLAREQGKEARLVLEGEGAEVDKSTADALAEPLLHLIRNAVDHGIEAPAVREERSKPRHGTITIAARHEGDAIRIEVRDDGAGLDLDGIREQARKAGLIGARERLSDEDVADLVFRPGFSTKSEVSTVSGRGVGLDVVMRRIRALRGELAMEPARDGGTTFVIRLPLTVAIVPSVVFRSSDELLALPASAITRTIRLEPAAVEHIGATEAVRDGDDLVPLARPDRLFGWGGADDGEYAVVIRHGTRSAAVTAQLVLDQRELVVKALPAYGGRPRGVVGASVLPGGELILMLDPAELIELNSERPRKGQRSGST